MDSTQIENRAEKVEPHLDKKNVSSLSRIIVITICNVNMRWVSRKGVFSFYVTHEEFYNPNKEYKQRPS